MLAFAKLILYLTLLVYCSRTIAQPVKVKLWRDSVRVSSGRTFVNRLTISNASLQRQELFVSINVPSAMQLLSSFPDKLNLTPGEIRMIPIKGLVGNDQTNWSENEVTIEVKSVTGNFIEGTSFPIIIDSKPQPAIFLYSSQDNVILYTKNDPAELPLRLVHNKPKQGIYYIDVAAVPNQIDRAGFPKQIALKARQDTSLTVVVNPLHSWSVNKAYELVITLRDEHQSIIGNVQYKVVVASTAKQYVTNDFYTKKDFGVSAAVTKLSTGQWAREGRIWGTDSVGNAQIDFHVHYLDYTSQNYRQLQNSYISFRTNRAMVRLGTSFDYHEMALYGQGLKATINQPNQQWTIWALNTNPNILNPSENAWSNIVSVRYDRELTTQPGSSWSFSSNYFSHSATKRAGYLNFASLRINRGERHSLEILGAHSLEFARTGLSPASAAGWAGQLNYSYQSPSFSWLLRSYVSSPVYAGWQRGATLINSQLLWSPTPDTRLSAMFNQMAYNQVRFVSPIDSYRSDFSNTLADVTLTHRFKSFMVSLRPYWYYQTDFNVPFVQKAVAYRVSPALFYTGRNNQRIELRYDVGTFGDRTTGAKPTLMSHRVVSSIGMGHFSFWGYWQKGPYYLSDLRTNQPDRVLTASLMPMLNFSMLNHHVYGAAGLNYLYDALYTGGRFMGVGRIQFDATPTLSMRLDGNATPYSERPELAFSQYRLEVVKRFHQVRLKHRGRLQLSFFEDANGNGVKETGERWIDSLLVTINDNTLFTNAKGIIRYQNLPPGKYMVSAVSLGHSGVPMQYHESITVNGSVKQLIPLAPTFPVKGQLRCQTSAYDQQACQLSRFVIEIQRDEQTISSTSFQPDGSFQTFLTPGNYTLNVRDYGRPVQSLIRTTSFTLSLTGEYPVLNWTVDGATRPVDVKRFSPKK